MLDDIDNLLLTALDGDARQSYRRLGEIVGLSPPAVADRIRRLERRGIVRGYRVEVDRRELGFPILAVIRFTSSEGRGAGFDEAVARLPEVLECLRVTGAESHVIVAAVRSTDHLEDLLEELWLYGTTITHIATSSPVPRRSLAGMLHTAAPGG